jgi:hypothetical protein
MAYERVVERFLNTKHDHIAAYTVETRGHRRPQPDKDPTLLTALAYEIEDFLGSLPKNYRTAELRGRLIYEFLRRVPRTIPIAARMDGGNGPHLRNGKNARVQREIGSTPPRRPQQAAS